MAGRRKPTKARKKASREKKQLRTVGDLRRALARMGNPWTVDSRLNDNDPLPVYPTGAKALTKQDAKQFTPVTDVKTAIRNTPPSNPFLRREWAKRGMLSAKEDYIPPGTSNEGKGAKKRRPAE